MKTDRDNVIRRGKMLKWKSSSSKPQKNVYLPVDSPKLSLVLTRIEVKGKQIHRSDLM